MFTFDKDLILYDYVLLQSKPFHSYITKY